MKITKRYGSLLIALLLIINTTNINAQTKKETNVITWGKYKMIELEGNWKESYNDNNLKITFNTDDFTGQISWNGGYYLNFEWQVKLGADKKPLFLKDDQTPADQSQYCQIMLKETTVNVKSDWDKVGDTFMYFCPSYAYLDGSPPLIIQRSKSWFFVKK